MTVHFVVRQVSSGPARNVKYLMPPTTTRDSQGSDGSICDRSSSPWRRKGKVCREELRAEEKEEGGAIFETRDRCVRSMPSSPPRTTFEMHITPSTNTHDRQIYEVARLQRMRNLPDLVALFTLSATAVRGEETGRRDVLPLSPHGTGCMKYRPSLFFPFKSAILFSFLRS